jgi:hypothetical protein
VCSYRRSEELQNHNGNKLRDRSNSLDKETCAKAHKQEAQRTWLGCGMYATEDIMKPKNANPGK